MSDLFCPQSVDYGDVATWLAAIATVAAVVVALRLAGNEGRRKEAERQRGAKIFATAIHPELGRLALSTAEHRRALLGADRIDWPGFIKSLRFIQLPVVDGSFDKVWLLDSDAAQSVSSARSSLLQLKNMVDRYVDRENMLQGDTESLIVLHAEMQKYANSAFRRACLVAGARADEANLPTSTNLSDYENRLLDWINQGSPPGTKPQRQHA